MVAYRGERVLATVPDLICAVDDKGNPLTNADIKKNMEITYIGYPAYPAFRTPAAVDLFKDILTGMEHHDEFRPIEELMGE
jgi:DUF917 family protein